MDPLGWIILGGLGIIVAYAIYASRKRHKAESGEFPRPPKGNEQER